MTSLSKKKKEITSISFFNYHPKFVIFFNKIGNFLFSTIPQIY